MWTYVQSTGWFGQTPQMMATGYSGKGAGKNKPAMEGMEGVGPIPCGTYKMQAPMDTQTHGPYVIWLTPSPLNEMFGRSAFGMHGDSFTHPGEASEGCIILPKFARQRAWESGDHELEVKPYP